MTYKKTEVNPESGKRLKEEIRRIGLSQEAFGEKVGLGKTYIGYMCNGNRAIPTDRAAQFAEIFGVRSEYLLGLDNFRTYDLEWLADETASGVKKQRFFEHCLNFWGYEISGNTPIYEEDPEGDRSIVGSGFKIRRPDGEIVEISGSKLDQLENEILRSTRRLLRETFDPEY